MKINLEEFKKDQLKIDNLTKLKGGSGSCGGGGVIFTRCAGKYTGSYFGSENDSSGTDKADY